MKKEINLSKILTNYQTGLILFDIKYDSDISYSSVLRDLLHKNQKKLNKEQLKELYEADKAHIELYQTVKDQEDNFSVIYLKDIVKIAQKFVKSYEKSNKKHLINH
jgi:hypothetical protein